jgi:hypothetical protein
MPKGVYEHKPHNGTFKKGCIPWTKGRTLSDEHRANIGKGNLGRQHTEEEKAKMCIAQKLRFQKTPVWNKGKKMSPEAIEKNRLAQTGKKHSLETRLKMGLSRTGEKNPKWIKDRTKLKKGDRKNSDVQYVYWARQVKMRDLWKCKLADGNCKGRMEAHHILTWRKYPELRYVLSNGITLCHFHHPHKYAEEIRLAETFQKLLSQIS